MTTWIVAVVLIALIGFFSQRVFDELDERNRR